MDENHRCGVDGWSWHSERMVCQRCIAQHPPLQRYRLGGGALWRDDDGDLVRVADVLAALDAAMQAWVEHGDSLGSLHGVRARVRGLGA